MSDWEDIFEGEPFTEELIDFTGGPEPNELDVEEDEMCDHEEHKEVVSMQEVRGATAMGLGGQFGTSEAFVVCKK